MPTYVYQEILEDGSEGETFELVQRMTDPPLEVNPVTGRRVRRLYFPPNVSAHHTPGSEKRTLDNANVERHGFTKYEKDKLTGRYHRVAGNKGPGTIDPQ